MKVSLASKVSQYIYFYILYQTGKLKLMCKTYKFFLSQDLKSKSKIELKQIHFVIFVVSVYFTLCLDSITVYFFSLKFSQSGAGMKYKTVSTGSDGFKAKKHYQVEVTQISFFYLIWQILFLFSGLWNEKSYLFKLDLSHIYMCVLTEYI